MSVALSSSLFVFSLSGCVRVVFVLVGLFVALSINKHGLFLLCLLLVLCRALVISGCVMWFVLRLFFPNFMCCVVCCVVCL